MDQQDTSKTTTFQERLKEMRAQPLDNVLKPILKFGAETVKHGLYVVTLPITLPLTIIGITGYSLYGICSSADILIKQDSAAAKTEFKKHFSPLKAHFSDLRMKNKSESIIKTIEDKIALGSAFGGLTTFGAALFTMVAAPIGAGVILVSSSVMSIFSKDEPAPSKKPEPAEVDKHSWIRDASINYDKEWVKAIAASKEPQTSNGLPRSPT